MALFVDGRGLGRHRDWVQVGSIPGFFSGFAQGSFMSRLSAVASAFGDHPFVLGPVVNETDCFSLRVGEVEDDGSAAFDELLRGVLRRCVG